MKWRTLIPAMIALLVLGGCIIDPPLHLRQALKTIVKVIWKADMYPDGQKPDGVTFYIFRDGQPYDRQTTSDVDSCRVHLVPGKYRIYMISQSPDEFWTMSFNDMDDFDNASISLNETEVNWLTPDPDSPVVLNPEMLMVGVSDEFEVTEDMADSFKDGDVVVPGEDGGYVNFYTLRIPITPMSVISQFWISIYSANADMLKSVRAATSGMARTFYLTQGVTGDEECTQIFTDWSLVIDDEEKKIGHLDSRITTLGLPRGEMPSVMRDSTLNVATLLIDNKTIERYTFFVGNKIYLDDPPPDGYLHLYRLILGTVENPVITPSIVEPPDGGGGGGFTAGVSDWDDELNSEVVI